MRRHIIHIAIAALMLANVACRTKRETATEQEAYHTEKVEHIAARDSVRDTLSIDLELRLRDVNLRVGTATLTASAAKVKARHRASPSTATTNREDRYHVRDSYCPPD